MPSCGLRWLKQHLVLNSFWAQFMYRMKDLFFTARITLKDILFMNNKYSLSVVMLGDLNSRTGVLSDFSNVYETGMNRSGMFLD